VNLVEAAYPPRVAGDGGVGGRIKVSVQAVFGRVNNNGVATVAFDVRVAAGVEMVAKGEFGTKTASER
jgi:hypothetical protein